MQSTSWRFIPGLEGRYQVSDAGTVRSVDRKLVDALGRVRNLKGKVLSPGPHPHGHLTVAIDGRSRWVHHLVLEAFVGPRPPGAVGCHYDDNPENNSVANLRWASQSDNVQDAIRNGRHLPSEQTHCKQGHELPPPTGGRRVCGQCARSRGREHSERIANIYGPDNPPPLNVTHCKYGHPMSGENLRLTSGRWVCRECNRERGRRFYRKNIGVAP